MASSSAMLHSRHYSLGISLLWVCTTFLWQSIVYKISSILKQTKAHWSSSMGKCSEWSWWPATTHDSSSAKECGLPLVLLEKMAQIGGESHGAISPSTKSIRWLRDILCQIWLKSKIMSKQNNQTSKRRHTKCHMVMPPIWLMTNDHLLLIIICIIIASMPRQGRGQCWS